MQQAMQVLTHEIVASHEARTAGLASLRSEVSASHKAKTAGLASLRSEISAQRDEAGRYVRGLRNARRDLSRRLRSDLAKGPPQQSRTEARRKSEIRKWLSGLPSARVRETSELRRWLGEVASIRQTTGQQQRDALARGRAELGLESRRLLRRMASTRQSAAREVGAWLRGIAEDRAAARRVWDQMGATLQERRVGAVPLEVPAPPREEVPTLVRETAPALPEEEAEKEEAVTEVGRIFTFLADHPDGVRLVELERRFDLSRLQAGRVVRSLIREGKAVKRNLLYFAT